LAIINGGSKYVPISVPVILQMTEDLLNIHSHLTCLYNPVWSFDTSLTEEGVETLPIAFFHVKKMQEIQSMDVSKKRVILYEAAEATQAYMQEKTRPGVMQTIVDNVVKNPREYQLEIIVPFGLWSRYFSDAVNNTASLIGFIARMLTDAVGTFGAADYSRTFIAR
jgi:hypothetical protein